MATVPIPWFTGAPVAGVSPYMGKALRERRNLQAISGLLGDVGGLVRKTRDQGLPPGVTDQQLADEEARLEAETRFQTETSNAQDKAQRDTVHGVERAAVAGDAPAEQRIKDDPAGYAAAKHEETQGFLPKLGNFMREGAERLLFGDPQRRERISHIRRMEGQLAAEKDRENFAKSVGQMCIKTEDPDACLRSMGGGRYGITHLPKAVQKPTLAQELGGGMPGYVAPPDKRMGGTWQQRKDWDDANRLVAQRHGGTMPSDKEVADREVNAAFDEIQKNRETAKEHAHDQRQKDFLDYKLAAQDAYRAQADLRRAARDNPTITESYIVYRDSHGRSWQLDEATAARLNRENPGFYLIPDRVTKRSKQAGTPPPPPPAGERPPPRGEKPSPPGAFVDPGKQYGAPDFYVPVLPQ